jgi:hypothetical protein
VGWRRRIDSVRIRRPLELRRGCAEKKMRSCRKTLAQTLAARRIMPAWAITAVPVWSRQWELWQHLSAVMVKC